MTTPFSFKGVNMKDPLQENYNFRKNVSMFIQKNSSIPLHRITKVMETPYLRRTFIELMDYAEYHNKHTLFNFAGGKQHRFKSATGKRCKKWKQKKDL